MPTLQLTGRIFDACKGERHLARPWDQPHASSSGCGTGSAIPITHGRSP